MYIRTTWLTRRVGSFFSSIICTAQIEAKGVAFNPFSSESLCIQLISVDGCSVIMIANLQANEEALTENTVISKAFPIIAGTSDISSQENLLFGNLKHLIDGFITKVKPDCYDGSRPADLNKQIREELGPYIVSSTNIVVPCLLNFFTEGKGLNGNIAACKATSFI